LDLFHGSKTSESTRIAVTDRLISLLSTLPVSENVQNERYRFLLINSVLVEGHDSDLLAFKRFLECLAHEYAADAKRLDRIYRDLGSALSHLPAAKKHQVFRALPSKIKTRIPVKLSVFELLVPFIGIA
jgi:hypothetical protein